MNEERQKKISDACKLARKACRNDDYVYGNVLAGNIIKEYPDCPEGYCIKAIAQIHFSYRDLINKNVDRAKERMKYVEKALNKSLELSEKNPQAEIFSTNALHRFLTVRHEEAKQFAAKTVELDEQNATGNFILALTLDDKKVEEKLKSFQIVVQELTTPHTHLDRWIVHTSKEYIKDHTPK